MSGQWPGSVRLEEVAARLPFEHLHRKRRPEEAIARWRAEADAYAMMDASARAQVCLVVTSGLRPRVQETLASWHLQTWPARHWAILGPGTSGGAIEETQGLFGLPPPLSSTSDPAELRDTLVRRGIEWVIPAAEGDVLHPSLAGTVATQASDTTALGWDWLEGIWNADALAVVSRHRAPFRDPLAELERDIRRRAFAVRLSHWRAVAGTDYRALRMAVRDSEVHHYPEPLAIYPSRSSEEDVGPISPAVASEWWGLAMQRSPRGCWLPAVRPGLASVVIMFRDRPELTAAAVSSVTRQQTSFPIEILLVNNGSAASSLAMLRAHVEAQCTGVSVRWIDYPFPFNHSRQCALAIDEARGEVILLLNNDAAFVEPDAVEQLVRWAFVPGVASVGAGIVAQDGTCVGGGFRARRVPGAEFNSPVEEAAGLLAEIPRCTVGNTFACVAICKSAYREVGVDGVRFPIGYNDVDYCLRAARRGFKHLNLAYVHARHLVGGTRAKCDEIAMKLRLRMEHPWLFQRALVEFETEAMSLGPVRLLA